MRLPSLGLLLWGKGTGLGLDCPEMLSGFLQQGRLCQLEQGGFPEQCWARPSPQEGSLDEERVW